MDLEDLIAEMELQQRLIDALFRLVVYGGTHCRVEAALDAIIEWAHDAKPEARRVRLVAALDRVLGGMKMPPSPQLNQLSSNRMLAK